jgi:hypothetical protein
MNSFSPSSGLEGGNHEKLAVLVHPDPGRIVRRSRRATPNAIRAERRSTGPAVPDELDDAVVGDCRCAVARSSTCPRTTGSKLKLEAFGAMFVDRIRSSSPTASRDRGGRPAARRRGESSLTIDLEALAQIGKIVVYGRGGRSSFKR